MNFEKWLVSANTPMKLAYKVFEPVNGSNTRLSPLIFLHGLALSKEYWDNIPQIIANNTGRKIPEFMIC
ncbi:UNVERIFIED_CONTAM: hypothetical protein NCL1_31667 [Trichonephila clavipes]